MGFEVLVHLAGNTGNVPYDILTNCLRWNLIAVLALFEQARLAGIRRFVVAGSCFEYGRSGERYAAIPTDAPLEPTNSYAASKAAASIALRQWVEERQLSLEILRFFHVYGEGESETSFWPLLRRAALADEDFPMTAGEQILDFIAVDDAAATLLHRATLALQDDSQTKVYNLSAGQPVSIRASAEYWWQHWGSRGLLLLGILLYRSDVVMRYVAGESCISLTKMTPENEPYVGWADRRSRIE